MADIELTTAEIPDKLRQEIIDIRSIRRNYRAEFLKKVERQQQEHYQNGKPFCYRCAKTDFEKAQEEQWTKTPRKERITLITERNVKPTFDTKPYGDKNRFEYLKTREIIDTRYVLGERVRYVTNFTEYACKVRGCRLSMELAETREEHKKA